MALLVYEFDTLNVRNYDVNVRKLHYDAEKFQNETAIKLLSLQYLLISSVEQPNYFVITTPLYNYKSKYLISNNPKRLSIDS